MMFHPSYISGYRLIMLADQRRKARARLARLSAYAFGSLAGVALIYSGWLF
jgi:hypothetical protein